MKMLGDELIFFKSLAKDFWKWFFPDRNCIFSMSFIRSVSKGFISGIEEGVLLDARPKWLFWFLLILFLLKK
jgi:hypothetical protein